MRKTPSRYLRKCERDKMPAMRKLMTVRDVPGVPHPGGYIKPTPGLRGWGYWSK